MRTKHDPVVCRAADDLAMLMQHQLSHVRSVLAQARHGREIDAAILIGTRLADIRTACDQIGLLLDLRR